MIRLTKKFFSDLGIWMLLLGTTTGIAFPFFLHALGVPTPIVYSPLFFALCVAAGIFVGSLNFLLARTIVESRIALMSSRMKDIEKRLHEVSILDDNFQCVGEHCHLPVDSDDFIGENARTFNALIAALQESFSMQRDYRVFTDVLNRHLELAELAQKGLEEMLRLSGASAGLIACESAGELVPAANIGILDVEAVLRNAMVKRTFESGTFRFLDFPPEVRADGVLLAFTPRQVALLPVKYKDIPIGILLLASARGFDERFADRIATFLKGLSLALNNSLAHERLQRMAALDPLTGVYNRRFGQVRLHEEFGRAVRSHSPLGLLMLDIDHFKSFNDTYGHLTGDRVIKSVASACRRCLREGDLLVRFGGEEFYVALPAAACTDLAAIGERIRRTVEEMKIPEGERSLSVTVSVGGAAFPCEGVNSEEDLLRLADEALYRAKQSGRNRVEIAPQTSV